MSSVSLSVAVGRVPSPGDVLLRWSPVRSPAFARRLRRGKPREGTRPTVSLLAGICSILVVGCLGANAQPAPRIDSVSPQWIQKGTTVDVTFRGTNLSAVTHVIFDGAAGLSATNIPRARVEMPTVRLESTGGGIASVPPGPVRNEARLKAKLTASADAVLGSREVRVVTPTGVSNPLRVRVGQWPEVAEKGPNSSIAQAQEVVLPASIGGVIAAAAEIDYYRFAAGKGDEIVVDVDGGTGSALDSSLALLDAAGKELARNEDHTGFDSLLEFTIPADGNYLIQLRDFRFQGGGNYTYRINVGLLPYLNSVFPFGAKRGSKVEVALRGRNLEGISKMTLDIAPNAPAEQEIRATTPKGLSNPIAFDVQDYPEFLESETNNVPTKANGIGAPGVANGQIGLPGDEDHFKFKVDKDQKLICEVMASRFGSRLDPLLVLMDGTGAILQQNDDAVGADARIEFDAKKDADYVLAVRDLTGGGGDDYPYRLAIKPPPPGQAPGFGARFLPEILRVHRNGVSALRAEVNRVGGFNGPVRLEFQGLPAGVFSEPIVLNESAASGLMILSALPEAPLGSFPLRLTASAMIGDKAVRQTAEAIAGNEAVRAGYVTVLDDPPFTIEATTLTAAVEQDETATVEVVAQRRNGFAGEIKLSADGFSAGRDPMTKSVEVKEQTLKANETVGKLALKAKTDSETGTRAFVVKGVATIDGSPVTQFTRPIPLTITPIPFLLSSTLERVQVTVLPPGSESAAGESSTTIKVDRRPGFTGEVALVIEEMPAGIKTELKNIPANGGETSLKIVATDKAVAGTNTFVVVGTSLHNDRTFKRKTGKVTLTVSAPETVEPAKPPVAAAAAAATTPVPGTAK